MAETNPSPYHHNPRGEQPLEMMPIRLIISLAVIALIMSLTAAAFQAVTPSIDAAHMRGTSNNVIVELGTMVSGGVARNLDDQNAPPGTQRLLMLDVPHGCSYISFGGDPDLDGDGILAPDVTGSGSVIVWWIEGIGKQVAWMPPGYPGFRAGVIFDERWMLSPQAYVIQGVGRHQILVEFVRQGSDSFFLFHGV